MQEELSVIEEPTKFDVGRMIGLVRRRHLQFILPFFLGWLIVWTVSWLIPVRYKSTTTILVQQPSVPQNYVTPNVSVNLQDRLASLTQQILSRTRLLLIANRLHLYQKSGKPAEPDDIVRRMRKDIKIDLVRDNPSNSITGFTVSYSANSPHLAQRVTSDLTTLFIQNNQATLQTESENTTKFLQQQLAKARTSLSEQEAQVRQFESTHQGALPTQQASNLQILSGLQSQLQNDEDSLNTARQQQVYFQSLIEQYNSLHAPGQGGTSDLATLDTQLANMKSRLANLKTRYTDRYPAVQELQDKIKTATNERKQLLAAAQSSAHQPQKQQANSATSAAPATSASVLQLKSQLQAIKTEIANRRRDIAEVKRRIGSYQSRLNAEPAIAAQLAALTRGYEQSQANYNELLKKENNSSMATSMEQMQQGERFSVLDPPSLPAAPDSPNRVKLSLMGIAIGLVFGLVVAGAAEFLDDRLYNDKDIEDLMPVAVIGEIPELVPADEQRKVKRKLTLAWTLTVLVFLAVIAGSAFNYANKSGPSITFNSFIATHHV